MKKFILALDQGTTSSRTVLYDTQFIKRDLEQKEFPQYFPNPGWVEHHADEIWESQYKTLKTILGRNKLSTQNIAAIGITNQRETIVAWDKKTGKPLSKAIVWQDRRTTKFCLQLKKNQWESVVSTKTGLLIDPYFSATKMRWMLKNVPAVKKAARTKRLAFGTIDSWLIFKLTGGNVHVTDSSNASRTLLFNIHTLKWDADLLKLFNIPLESLPTVLNSNAHFGTVTIPELSGVEICAVAGDQQASLFGHRCFKSGEMKNTYGTGCFLLKNIGTEYAQPPKGILGTIAWTLNGKTTYAHEGSVMIGGAVIQFLRDGLQLLKTATDSDKLSAELKSNDDVYFVPAFAGLGTPHWDPTARGLIIGLTRGTTRAHLIRSALESIAFQSADLCDSLHRGRKKIDRLQVDGGASQNNFLMQFQADILGCEIHVNKNYEMTALGIAMLAALGCGLIQSIEDLDKIKLSIKIFKPKMKTALRKSILGKWKNAVARSRNWEQ